MDRVRACSRRSLGLLAAILILGSPLLFADTSYQIDITTFYSTGCATYGPCGAPDTGFFTIHNAGASTFLGTLDMAAASNFNGNYSGSWSLLLFPGNTFTFGTTPESSNFGGFNGPYGLPQPGIGLTFHGDFFNGSDVLLGQTLSVFDKDIHSGVFSVSPCDGMLTDAYVLQGGSPTGCDNGDGYELAQAPGHYSFVHQAGNPVPEPSSLVLLGSGMLAGIRTLRRKLSM